MKSKLLIIFSICASMLYAEDNIYIKHGGIIVSRF